MIICKTKSSFKKPFHPKKPFYKKDSSRIVGFLSFTLSSRFFKFVPLVLADQKFVLLGQAKEPFKVLVSTFISKSVEWQNELKYYLKASVALMQSGPSKPCCCRCCTWTVFHPPRATSLFPFPFVICLDPPPPLTSLCSFTFTLFLGAKSRSLPTVPPLPPCLHALARR